MLLENLFDHFAVREQLYGTVALSWQNAALILGTNQFALVQQGHVAVVLSCPTCPLSQVELHEIVLGLVDLEVAGIVLLNITLEMDSALLCAEAHIPYVELIYKPTKTTVPNSSHTQVTLLDQLRYHFMVLSEWGALDLAKLCERLHYVYGRQLCLIGPGKQLLYGEDSATGLHLVRELQLTHALHRMHRAKISNVSTFSTNSQHYYGYSIHQHQLDNMYLILQASAAEQANYIHSLKELLPYFSLAMAYGNQKRQTETSLPSFLQDLIVGSILSESEIKAKALANSIPFSEPRYLWILEVLSPLGHHISSSILLKIIDVLRIHFPNNHFLIYEHKIISIQTDQWLSYDEQQLPYLKSLKQLYQEYPELQFTLGFSRTYQKLSSLFDAYCDATLGIKLYKLYFENTMENEIPFYTKLLLHHIAFDHIDSPIFQKLYDCIIVPLLEADSATDDCLIKTLTTLVDTNFNHAEAANLLYIHRNTLYQRLQRVERILNMSIKDLSTRTLLHMGIIVHSIYKVDNHVQ